MQELREIKNDDNVVINKIHNYLGEEANYLLNHKCEKISFLQ